MAMYDPEARSVGSKEEQRVKSRQELIRTICTALNTILLTTILAVLLKVYIVGAPVCRIHESSELLRDVNSIVPEFPVQKVLFQNDSSYAQTAMFENESVFNKTLERWNRDMPPGQGFVVVKDAKKYDLGPPMQYKNVPGDGYSIASLHQYHCLYRIMYMYGLAKFKRHDSDPDMTRHIAHCFDYLRQSVQCSGDSALEGRSTTIDDMADGWGVMHMCRSNTELVKWVTDNRYTNDTGVD